MVEYAKKGNKLVSVVRVTAETLSGIPSIVYGLFGMLFFVTTLKWSYSMLSGAFTLAIMILPLIMRTTEAVSYTHLLHYFVQDTRQFAETDRRNNRNIRYGLDIVHI